MLDRGRMKWYGAANHEAEEVAYAIITNQGGGAGVLSLHEPSRGSADDSR
jgi:hypothetical protein